MSLTSTYAVRGAIPGRGRPLTCIAAVTQVVPRWPHSRFAGVLHCAPLPSLLPVSASGPPGQGARSARAAAPQAPLTRPPGSGSWPAGGKGANLRRDRRFRDCWRGAFLAGIGVTCSMTGRGAARDSQAYLGPRARAAPGDMMIDWAVLPPAGGCGRSVYTGRPPGPARQDRERLTADWGELAAVVPHRVSSAPARRPARPRQDGHHGTRWRAQAAVSASSPSSARMWQACRRILRASDRAARLPPWRSLTAA